VNDDSRFTFRTARSASLVAGLILVIAVETIVLHFFLSPAHPVIAWTLTAMSVSTAVWLLGDFRAMGRSALQVSATDLHLRVGWRATAAVPRSTVTTATRSTWRDLPAAGASQYLNLTKPSEPNVLLTFEPAAEIRLAGGLTLRACVIGVHVDAPDELVTLLQPAVSNASV
jgi:hypothetical protein